MVQLTAMVVSQIEVILKAPRIESYMGKLVSSGFYEVLSNVCYISKQTPSIVQAWVSSQPFSNFSSLILSLGLYCLAHEGHLHEDREERIADLVPCLTASLIL